jgi:hypothetical protein
MTYSDSGKNNTDDEKNDADLIKEATERLARIFVAQILSAKSGKDNITSKEKKQAS